MADTFKITFPKNTGVMVTAWACLDDFHAYHLTRKEARNHCATEESKNPQPKGGE